MYTCNPCNVFFASLKEIGSTREIRQGSEKEITCRVYVIFTKTINVAFISLSYIYIYGYSFARSCNEVSGFHLRSSEEMMATALASPAKLRAFAPLRPFQVGFSVLVPNPKYPISSSRASPINGRLGGATIRSLRPVIIAHSSPGTSQRCVFACDHDEICWLR